MWMVSIPSKAGWLLQFEQPNLKDQLREGFNPLKGGVVVAINYAIKLNRAEFQFQSPQRRGGCCNLLAQGM